MSEYNRPWRTGEGKKERLFFLVLDAFSTAFRVTPPVFFWGGKVSLYGSSSSEPSPLGNWIR